MRNIYQLILFDNIIYNLQHIGGISVCWTELLKRIEEKCIEHEYIEYPGSTDNLLRKSLHLTNINIRKKRLLERYMPLHIKHHDLFIFHSSYYRYTVNKKAKQIVTVHDFIYEKFSNGLKKKVHSFQKSKAMSKADILVCVSESTKNDMLYYYPELKNKNVKIVYNGVGKSFFPINTKELSCIFSNLNNLKYILIVGGRYKHKKFKFIADVFSKIDTSFDIVIVGSSLTNEEKQWLHYDHNSNRIHHYKNVSDDDLNILYNNAYCLFYPSLYEGFGIPIIEAMKTGCPVVTTTFSSIPEVAGNAALYIEGFSIDSAIAEIKKLESPTIRNEIKAKSLINAERFSWDKNFSEYLEIYKELSFK